MKPPIRTFIEETEPLWKTLYNELKKNPLVVKGQSIYDEAKTELGNVLRQRAAEELPESMRNKPIIKSTHSTKHLFDSPSFEKNVQSTGIGDTWQAPGLYGTEEKGVENYYRERGADWRSIGRLPSGKLLDLTALNDLAKKLPAGDPRQDIIDRLHIAASRYSTETPEELMQQLRSVRSEAIQDILEHKRNVQNWKSQGRSNKRGPKKDYDMGSLWDYNNLADLIAPRFDRPAKIGEYVDDFPRQATYNVEFAASPDELFDLQKKVTEQPSSARLIAALESVRGADRTSLLDRILNGYQQAPAPFNTPYSLNELLVGNKYAPDHRMRVLGSYDMSDLLSDEYNIMQLFRDKGIVGNKYLTALAAKDPTLPQTYNYVMQDPNRIRLTDVFAMAPLGMALNAANQEKPKKKK